MKRVTQLQVAILAVMLFFLAGVAQALVPVSSGTVTKANMRLSVVDGTAFVDFSSADTLTPYLGYKVVITDSSGKTLTGYIKAAGTGETYGSELLPNTSFADTNSVWSYGGATVSVVAGGQSGNALKLTSPPNGDNGAGQNFTLAPGKLARYTVYTKNGNISLSEDAWWYENSIGSAAPAYIAWASVDARNDTNWTPHTIYGTATQDSNQISMGNYVEGRSCITYMDTASVKQVLAPSATGVTISSTRNGSTYNWANEATGFNRNDSSGYTYAIYPGSVNTTIGSVAQTDMRLSIVNGTSFADFSSADTLTPYLGSKLVITDSTGKTLTGYIKAAGTGETYGSELTGNQTFEDTNGLVSVRSTVASVVGGESGKCLEITGASAYPGMQTPNPFYAGSSGNLYKFTGYSKRGTDTGVWLSIAQWDGNAYEDLGGGYWNDQASWVQTTLYGTSRVGVQQIYFSAIMNTSGFTGYIDTFSGKQVLTPSTTGVTITSTQNGSTYNWTSEDTGFNRNDSSGYTYAIYPGNESRTGAMASSQLVDCADSVGTLGVNVVGTNTLQNYTVVRCPAGAFQFEETAALKNSIGISSGNDITIASGKTVTGTNNLFGDSGKSGSGTYANTGTLWSSDPLFVAPSDFHLQPSSPAIESGTTTSNSTDFLGNPIYGLPDIGAIEYQPPYTMGVDRPDTGANVRVYADGKFRNTQAASGTTAALSILPQISTTTQWLDIAILTWHTSDDYSRAWTESSTTITSPTDHAVGDLIPNMSYTISVDGTPGFGISGSSCTAEHCTSNGSGVLTFTYSGGYSTHNFTMTLDTSSISGTVMASGSPLSGVTVTGSGALGNQTTDLAGYYTFTGVSYGTGYTLTPAKTGYTFSPSSASGTVAGNIVQDFSATLNTHTISGQIAVGGSPLSGATVTGSGALGNQTTDLAGLYTFTGVSYGTGYTLTPTKTGYTFSPSSASGTVAGNVLQNFSATLNTHTISGQITVGGSPLTGVTVNCGALIPPSTNASGAYTFANVPYGTSCTLTPTMTGYTFNPLSIPITLNSNASHNFTATAKDSDSDGVNDPQELTDGTNPNDSGSARKTRETTLCAEWNSYFEMWNILEHLNLGTTKLEVKTTLHDLLGDAQTSIAFGLNPGRQYDLLVHDLTGYQANSYGVVCSTATNGQSGELDGRMVFYKPEPATGGYQFAFALSLGSGLKGTQYVPYNTYQPSLDPADAGNLAANWIQIANLDSQKQTGILVFYDQRGEEIARQAVTLQAGSRFYYSGHDIAGRSQVGLVGWIPTASDAPFQLRNVRYLYQADGKNFDGALQLEGIIGSGELLTVALDTRGSSAVLEIANTRDEEVKAEVTIYPASGGEALNQQTYKLPPHATYHLIVDSILERQEGIATIKGNKPESVIATAMHYGRTATLGIQTSYGIQARQALGTAMRGSYNTFLKQDCRLLLVNPTSSEVITTISTRRYDGTTAIYSNMLPVPAHGLTNYPLCLVENEENVYGVVTVQPASRNTVFATVLRIGENEQYRFPTPVRE